MYLMKELSEMEDSRPCISMSREFLDAYIGKGPPAMSHLVENVVFD
jgi:hypothetical protein